MNLDEAQRQRVTAWVLQGAKLSEIQTRLAEEFKIKLTYMEVRFLVDDLGLVLKNPVQPEPKAGADLKGLSKHALAIAKGLQKYGMFVADNGGDWRLSIAPDSRIKGLDDLRRFKGSDFEVVQTTGENEGPWKQ